MAETLCIDSISSILASCRAPDSMPIGTWGLWTIARLTLPVTFEGYARIGFPARDGMVSYTLLGRATMATLHEPYGEIVMEDSRRELARHLPLLLRARGRVMISGLGLGCVVRGLLANPRVDHVDVVELDPTILDVVGPEFAGDPRVTLHRGDALTIAWPAGTRWDYAWHDVWCEEGSLDVLHAQLLARYRSLANHQGAWQFDRRVKRRWPDRLLNSRRRHRV